MGEEAEQKKAKKKASYSSDLLGDFTGYGKGYDLGTESPLSQLIQQEKGSFKNIFAKGDSFSPESLSNLKSKFEKYFDDSFHKTIIANGTRRENLEGQLMERYGSEVEKIFLPTGVVPEYIPIYQAKEGKDDELFKLHEEWVIGYYSRHLKVAVIKSTTKKEFENKVALHETIHHNLKLLRDLEHIGDKEDYVEEGMASFLTALVMGKDLDILEREAKKKYPEIYAAQRVKARAPYGIGQQIFKLIYDHLGIEGIFAAYKKSCNSDDLNDFLFENHIDIYPKTKRGKSRKSN